MSDPMIVASNFESQDKLVRKLAHELTHRLLADNTSSSRLDKRDFEKLQVLFGNKPFGELVHIAVNAVMKSVYLDVLNRSDLFEIDMHDAKEWNKTDYSNAWNYVNTHDYMEIIEKVKNFNR